MMATPPSFRVTYLAATGSTNDDAKTAAASGAPDGAVFWTENQSAGRGTHGRDWTAPPGNLAVSVLRRPKIPLRHAPQSALVTAVALAEALEELGIPGKRIRLKWPNDVLVDGRKISGILMEGEAEGANTAWIVVGTGLNLRHHPGDARYPATDLSALGFEIEAQAALAAYLTAFHRWWERWLRYDFAVVGTAWMARSVHRPGETLAISQGAARIEVTFGGLAADGALVARGLDGVEKRIVSGELLAPGSSLPLETD
jgi:BirA family biotin operon repressor/biotin-[acetyl-CoA-carboxylase] ligase